MNKSEILFGASKSLVLKTFGLLSAYLFAFVVSRFFGAQAWGEFSLALSIILPGALFGTAGLDLAIVKITADPGKKNKQSTQYRTGLFLVMCFSICASLIIYFMSGWFSDILFNSPQLHSSFKLAAFAILPLSVLNLNSGALQGMEKINKYVFLRFISRHISALFLTGILVLVWRDSRIVLIAYISGLYLMALFSFYWVTKAGIRFHNFHIRNENNQVIAGKLLKLSMPLMFAGSLMFLNSWIDTIMVGVFLTEKDVGIYTITLKTSGLILIVISSVNAVLTPKISALYSSNRMDDLQDIIQYSTSVIFFASIPIFLILVLFPEQILNLFGVEFQTGKYALMILAVGNMFNAFAGSVGYVMQMTGSQVAFQNITLLSSILAIALNLILIPLYGIEGAALATGLSVIFWNVTGVLFIRYRYNISTNFRPLEIWRNR